MPLPELLQGASFGFFTLQRRLGSSRSGELWLASKAPGEFAALKFFPLNPAGDQPVLSFLNWEATVQNQIFAECGHTVPILEIFRGSESCPPYCASAFIEGESLAQRLDREKKLPPLDALAIVRPLLIALSVAHQANHIHGDIKPSKVLLDTAGKAYLAGFGVSRALEDRLPIEITYRSPEEWSGTRPDVRSDLFALGCLTHLMLTGRAPGKSPLSIREWNPAVSPELEDVVYRLLEQDPRNRFATCADLLSALESLPLAKPLTGPGLSSTAALR